MAEAEAAGWGRQKMGERRKLALLLLRPPRAGGSSVKFISFSPAPASPSRCPLRAQDGSGSEWTWGLYLQTGGSWFAKDTIPRLPRPIIAPSRFPKWGSVGCGPAGNSLPPQPPDREYVPREALRRAGRKFWRSGFPPPPPPARMSKCSQSLKCLRPPSDSHCHCGKCTHAPILQTGKLRL